MARTFTTSLCHDCCKSCMLVWSWMVMGIIRGSSGWMVCACSIWQSLLYMYSQMLSWYVHCVAASVLSEVTCSSVSGAWRSLLVWSVGVGSGSSG
eukprot:3077839-Prorocentrum_lima.AAC.1